MRIDFRPRLLKLIFFYNKINSLNSVARLASKFIRGRCPLILYSSTEAVIPGIAQGTENPVVCCLPDGHKPLMQSRIINNILLLNDHDY